MTKSVILRSKESNLVRVITLPDETNRRVLTLDEQLLIEQDKKIQKYKKWFLAVTNAMAVNNIEWDENDAFKSVEQLIDFVSVATLDPAISAPAQDLINKGYALACQDTGPAPLGNY